MHRLRSRGERANDNHCAEQLSQHGLPFQDPEHRHGRPWE